MKDSQLIKVVYLPNMNHIINVSTDGKILRGIEGKLLKLISESLNFRYEFVQPKDMEYGGEKENGNWSGIIGLLREGKADMAANVISIIKERFDAVNFTYPYGGDIMTFITSMPKQRTKFWSCVYPFDGLTWFFIVAFLIFLPVVYHALMQRRYPLGQYFTETYGTLLRQPSSFGLVKASDRILYVLWVIGAMIVAYSYSAILLSFLVLPLYEPGIRDKADLATSMQTGEHGLWVAEGSSELTFLQNCPQQTIQIIKNHTQVLHPQVYRNDYFIRSGIESRKWSLMNSRPMLQIRFAQYLQKSMYLSNDPFFYSYVGIAVSPSFCCLDKLNVVIQRIVSAGLYQKFYDDEFFQIALASSSELKREMDGKTLSMNDLLGAFIVLVSGLTISIIAFLCEIIINMKNK